MSLLSDVERAPIDYYCQLFRRRLGNDVNVSFPLGHFSQHSDEASIRDAAKQETDKCCVFFTKKLNKTLEISPNRRGILLGELISRIDEVVDDCVTSNLNRKAKWVSFLEKRIDSICENLRTSFETNLFINPDINIQSVEGFFEIEKESAMNYFQKWKHGNLGTFEEQRTKLEQKLNDLRKEMIEHQNHHFAAQDACKELEDVKTNVWKTSKLIRDEVDVREVNLKQTLKEAVSHFLDYLKQDESVLLEKHGKLYAQLLELLKSEMTSLNELESEEEAVTWAYQLERKLKSLFIEYEKEVPSVQQQKIIIVEEAATASDSNPNPASSNTKGGSTLTIERVQESVPDEPKESLDLAATHKVKKDGGVPAPSKAMNGGQKNEALILPSEQEPESDSDSVSEYEKNTDHVDLGFEKCHPKILTEPTAIIAPTPSASLKAFTPTNPRRDVIGKPGVKRDRKKIFIAPPLASASKIKKAFSKSSTSNAHNEDDYAEFLSALRQGHSVDDIQKILDAGANVNFKTRTRNNAAHAVIMSLIERKQTSAGALAILNLLVSKGFNLVNGEDASDLTPLCLAMEYDDLDEGLLNWFLEHDADFNAVESKCGNSVLLEAIFYGRDAGVIRKLLEFGADPNHVNEMGNDALHMAAFLAQHGALEILVDQVDVNGLNPDNSTALGMLFMEGGLKYQRCLDLLLRKGADLRGSCEQGCANTLVHWLKHGKTNAIPVLMESKIRLPITQEIASAALTAIVEEIERLQIHLLSHDEHEQSAFADFILSLIEDKNAKLIPKGDGGKWRLQNLQEVNKVVTRIVFVRKLHTIVSWKGALLRLKTATLDKFEFQTDAGRNGGTFTVPTELVLACLLACENYEGFVNVCRSLNMAQNESEVWRKDEAPKCVVQ